MQASTLRAILDCVLNGHGDPDIVFNDSELGYQDVNFVAIDDHRMPGDLMVVIDADRDDLYANSDYVRAWKLKDCVNPVRPGEKIIMHAVRPEPAPEARWDEGYG